MSTTALAFSALAALFLGALASGCGADVPTVEVLEAGTYSVRFTVLYTDCANDETGRTGTEQSTLRQTGELWEYVDEHGDTYVKGYRVGDVYVLEHYEEGRDERGIIWFSIRDTWVVTPTAEGFIGNTTFQAMDTRTPGPLGNCTLHGELEGSNK